MGKTNSKRGVLPNSTSQSRRGPLKKGNVQTQGISGRSQYNPTWNPQFFKVARQFQLSAPAADFGAGFGKYQDFAVGASATLLAYNSAAYTFGISDVPSVAEFTTLFDQYRISKVILEFQYLSGSAVLVSTAGANQYEVSLMVFEDNDDSTAPTASNAGWQAVLETGRATRKLFPESGSNTLRYSLTPKVKSADVDSAGTTLARSLTSGWFDAATTDAQYFGLKLICQANPSAVTVGHSWRATATYFLEFRNRQ
jgi:hypothetical protein